jgi:2-polyprenyl-3-methyl-5-hydroxy-6-metoxy-1,4-benzoquinol methylase
MKYGDVAQNYDEEFKDDQAAQKWWDSGEPTPLVRALEKFITSGNVLDMGAGVGQNRIYLASRGFDVLATDISGVAIQRIRENAHKNAVSLRAQVIDVVHQELENEFDVILCLGVLHHLHSDDALLVIKKIQQHTKPMGFNAINAFTRRGAFYASDPNTRNFYVDGKDDLAKLYSGWALHICFEKEGPANQKGGRGEALLNTFTAVLSQRT